MTVIATDGYSIASDTRAAQDGLIIQRPWHKLHPLPDGSVVGSAGDSELGVLFLDWLESGEESSARPDWSDEDFAAMRLYPDGTIMVYTAHCVPEPVPAPFAIGSGHKLALGALEAGASPLRAVEIACIYDASCGIPIDTVVVRHRKGRKRAKRGNAPTEPVRTGSPHLAGQNA